ncbi:hypothetical protein CS0771_59640 [Catellatospora sp. IY07-71]|nr:hypothetical protein CS0771_59640 [Catellatospora sp. IY07-71]
MAVAAFHVMGPPGRAHHSAAAVAGWHYRADMELLIWVLAVAALLVALTLFVVARRSHSRSTLDPSQDVYTGPSRGAEIHKPGHMP